MRSVKRFILRVTPSWSHKALREMNKKWIQISTSGTGCYCPVCQQQFRRYITGGVIPRPRDCCPACRCLARQRLVWLFFENETNLFQERSLRVLHFAPEKQMMRRLLEIESLDYLTADLDGSRAMLKMDITSISEPDDSFDVVYCSHVLEHVTEDRQAMAELYRVLRPGGWAVLLVPIRGQETYEDPAIQTPEARRKAYDQEDHVRMYGRDFKDRLAEAGFSVEESAYALHFEPNDRRRYGLDDSDLIYYCHKPSKN